MSAGARLFIATDHGLGLLRGMSLTTLRGEPGLPFEDLTSLVQLGYPRHNLRQRNHFPPDSVVHFEDRFSSC